MTEILETIKNSTKNYAFLSGNAYAVLKQDFQEYIRENSIRDQRINGYWIEINSSFYYNICSLVLLEYFNEVNIDVLRSDNS